MKILTLGDSWTYGTNSSDPETKSWPAQMASKYGVEVVNLARGGSSNHRAMRIGLEEICRNPKYDFIVWPLAPASRTEILNHGKWHQIWPGHGGTEIDRIYSKFWCSWNDVQSTMMLVLQFSLSMKALGIPLYVAGLSLHPNQYCKEMSWITEYNDDFDFNKLKMPLDQLNIGISDLDRKLKSLRAIHQTILKHQPDYWFDVIDNYLRSSTVQSRYGFSYQEFGGHPNDNGYHALADFFADKLGLTTGT